MGYFNYFIKCIIRNIARLICKPKFLIIILLCVIVLLFCLENYGYCAETVNPSEFDGYSYIQHDNHFLTLQKIQENLQHQVIAKLYLIYGTSSGYENAKYVANQFMQGLLYSANGQRLPIVMESEEGYIFCTYAKNGVSAVSSDGYFTFPQFNSNTNKVVFDNVSYSSTVVNRLKMGFNNSLYPDGGETVTLKAPTAFFNVMVPEWITLFQDFGLINNTTDSEIIRLLTQLVNSSSSANIVGAINEGNRLQQENNQLQNQGNQLQQEQNNLLKDDNVNTDGFEFAKDNTVNPTENGFNSLFTSIYNTFCSTESKPLTITLPYINQTFSINPNLVSGAMQKAGLGVVTTLIHSFYYYCVCLFIYKDINKIIEHLKSGNLTADCGNVQTEVL